MMLDPSLDLNVRNEVFKAPVHLAAEFGHLEVLVQLKKSENIVFDLEDINRDTPLHRAAAMGHLECVRYMMVHHTCNPNKKNRYN
jgi:ankyrin repeat protein